MRTSIPVFLTLVVLSFPSHGVWTPLAPGMELGTFVTGRQHPNEESKVKLVRIDPNRWDLVLLGASRIGESRGMTAKRWCEEYELSAAINAGMFGTDLTTHVGYMRTASHVNNSHINAYKSVAAFNPREGKGLPRFRIFDLDDPDVTMKGIVDNYASVLQNLRLIKRPGINRWRKRDEKWSEAALGEDQQGRVLFIFSRTPHSMHDLNRELLSLGIGLVAAQHLEGGAQAQLYLNVGDTALELYGGLDTAFLNDGGIVTRRPIPNIIGVRSKAD